MSTSISHTAKDFADAIQKQVKQDMKDSLYAAQQALNNTAFKARNNLFHRFQGVFDIHNKNFFSTNIRKGVLVKKADRKKDGIDMKVDITFPHDWFAIQASGGVKVPGMQKDGKQHKMLAIPTSKGAVKINQSGKITGARATKMLDYYFKHPKKTKGHVKNPHAFILKHATSKGKDVIAKRNKEDRTKLDFYYVLQPELKVKKNWDFYGVIQKTFDRHLDEEFDKALKWCLEHPKK